MACLSRKCKEHVLAQYGGLEVTFSQSDFYKVNEIVFKPLLFDFSKVERVVCSSLYCLTLVQQISYW